MLANLFGFIFTGEMKKHFLKCWPIPFRYLRIGRKGCEIRKNDRDFKEGDTLVIQEWDQLGKYYTGMELIFIITHVQDSFGLKDGYVVLSISPVKIKPNKLASKKCESCKKFGKPIRRLLSYALAYCTWPSDDKRRDAVNTVLRLKEFEEKKKEPPEKPEDRISMCGYPGR